MTPSWSAAAASKAAALPRCIFLVPFEHVEDPGVQREGVAHFEELQRSCAPEWREAIRSFLDFARSHLEIVERFGRFPHRNAILGREPTPEEQAWLEGGGARFGQG